jgi:hypothetical protein
MRSTPRGARRRSLLDRAAHVAFTFIVMNASAVEALVAVVLGRKVWRR